jgi:ribose 1,5-bisphosphokinase
LLARRHITRPAGAGGEEHFAITPEAFRDRLLGGGFAMHWRSHGYDYGIDSDIDTHLTKGWQVVVNGSRHYLESARNRYPTNLRPLLVTVSHNQLFERLVRRGRESSEEIEQRLQRAEALDAQLRHQSLLRLSNNGPLEAAGDRLLEMILQAVETTRRSAISEATAG